MKITADKKLLFLSSLLIVGLACTLPIYFGAPVEQEVKEVVIVVTATPEAEIIQPTMEPAAPTTNAVTPTVSVNLGGEWVVWQGSNTQRLDIDFLQQGYSLVGNAATGGGHSILFKGTISQDGKSVTGNWEKTDGSSGVFNIYLDTALANFSGNLGGGVPFCGTRSGASQPSPCLK
jgi:hypothetical protein